MTRFTTSLRTPPQELRIKVAPAAQRGVRLDLGDRHVYLTDQLARDLADALVDAAESKVEK